MPEITNHGKLFFDKKRWLMVAYQGSFSALWGNNAPYAP
jgi:hypothetical protein